MAVLPPSYLFTGFANFFMFPKLKTKLRGCHFDTIVDIQTELRKLLNRQTFRKHSTNGGSTKTMLTAHQRTASRVTVPTRSYDTACRSLAMNKSYLWLKYWLYFSFFSTQPKMKTPTSACKNLEYCLYQSQQCGDNLDERNAKKFNKLSIMPHLRLS